ncbi:MAG TPA: AAA family ATPase [Candidatus Tumulicola sp.]|jgi:cytidylate kinase
MIVYLNGAFGIGKTTVARLLMARIPEAILFDPELIGSVVTETLGSLDPKSDFQQYESWSELVGACLRSFRNAYPRSTIVVPMSLSNERIRDRTIAAMREADADFCPFTLVANTEELERRIYGRECSDASRAWCLQHVAAAPKPQAGDETVIDTTALAPEAVADRILDAIAKRG